MCYLIVRVWVPQKRMFDASRMPFNFLRLIKYPEPEKLFDPPELEKVADFQTAAATGAGAKHTSSSAGGRSSAFCSRRQPPRPSWFA